MSCIALVAIGTQSSTQASSCGTRHCGRSRRTAAPRVRIDAGRRRRHRQAARQQDPELAALLHAPRLGGGLLAVAEEVVGPHRAADGAAGVLRDGEALHRRAGVGRARRDEHRVAQRRGARVDRDRAAGLQRHAEGADRAAGAADGFLEEDVARVLDAGAEHRRWRHAGPAPPPRRWPPAAASVKPRVRITVAVGDLVVAVVQLELARRRPRVRTRLSALPEADCASVGRKGWPFCSA